jgi:hypothetical protein
MSLWIARSWVAIVLVGSLLAGTAAAKNISISISPTVELQGETLSVRVKVTNGGDEAAHSVVPVVHFGEHEARGTVRDALGPNQSLEQTLSLPVGKLGPGRWPYQLAIDYADANQYPFQALHVGLLTTGNPPPAKAAVPEVAAGQVDKSGSARVKVKNLAAADRKATVTMIVPDGLEATKATQELGLAGWEEKSLSFPLVNRTALPGSRYPVFVVVQYDDGDAHQTVLSQGLVDILASQSFFQRSQNLLWVGAGVLVLAWLAFVVWSATVRRPRRAQSRS